MATERLPMRKAHEILRTKWELGFSNRQAARSTGVSPATVANVVRRAKTAGLASYAAAAALDEETLERLLYGEPEGDASYPRPEPDCAWIHRERSRPGVTLELLHLEYIEQHPHGYQYTAFCDRYRAFQKRRGLVMRQHHVAGDKLFVNYSGKKPSIVILDDWGLAPLNDQQRRDVLEVLEDRHGARSTVVTSQMPVENWHDYIAHQTIADAVLDRLVHNAHKIKMKGPSRRKERAQASL